MNHVKKVIVFFVLAVVAVGCSQLKGGTIRQAEVPETTVELQDINLNMLYAMIENLDTEIAAVKQVPAGPYPLYEQLRSTDLAGMEARKELMVILVEHCRFSKEKLLEAEKHPERKQQILQEWMQHKERMASLLDEADKKANGLQRKRIRLEFDLIQATLEKK
jgi:hypothetical protein